MALFANLSLKRIAAAGIACTAFLIGGAEIAGQEQPNDSKSTQTVTVVGCPVHGVEGGCLVITGKDGKTWNIGAAKPRPRVGYRAVSLTGQPTRKASICMQGTALDDIQWTYTDEQCPEPKPE